MKNTFIKNFYRVNQARNIPELIDLIGAWSMVFVNDLNTKCSPNRIFSNGSDKTLFVDCDAEALIDLMSYKILIINKVNLYFAKEIINSVVFTVRFF